MLNCGNKTGKAVSNTDSLTMDSIVADTGMDKHSEAYIRQRIDTIYKTVGKSVYDSKGNEVSYINNPFNRDSAYCSERYYALMQKALQLCNETGDILYDYDYWVCGQDFSDNWRDGAKRNLSDYAEETATRKNSLPVVKPLSTYPSLPDCSNCIACKELFPPWE